MTDEKNIHRGASFLFVAASLVDSANLANSLWGLSIQTWLYGIGSSFVFLGLFFGIMISWSEYKAKTH